MKRTSASFLCIGFAAVGLLHCASSDGSGSSASSQQPTDPATSDGGDANAAAVPPPSGGACNALTNDGPTIAAIDVIATAAPLPTGGAFVDGTYHLKAITLYSGPTGTAGKYPITLKGTVRLQGNVAEEVLEGTKGDGSALSERTAETFSTAGSTATYTMTCPDKRTRTAAYSVAGATLTLFLQNDVGQTVGYTYGP